jgi:hypothetical protein
MLDYNQVLALNQTTTQKSSSFSDISIHFINKFSSSVNGPGQFSENRTMSGSPGQTCIGNEYSTNSPCFH